MNKIENDLLNNSALEAINQNQSFQLQEAYTDNSLMSIVSENKRFQKIPCPDCLENVFEFSRAELIKHRLQEHNVISCFCHPDTKIFSTIAEKNIHQRQIKYEKEKEKKKFENKSMLQIKPKINMPNTEFDILQQNLAKVRQKMGIKYERQDELIELEEDKKEKKQKGAKNEDKRKNHPSIEKGVKPADFPQFDQYDDDQARVISEWSQKTIKKPLKAKQRDGMWALLNKNRFGIDGPRQRMELKFKTVAFSSQFKTKVDQVQYGTCNYIFGIINGVTGYERKDFFDRTTLVYEHNPAKDYCMFIDPNPPILELNGVPIFKALFQNPPYQNNDVSVVKAIQAQWYSCLLPSVWIIKTDWITNKNTKKFWDKMEIPEEQFDHIGEVAFELCPKASPFKVSIVYLCSQEQFNTYKQRPDYKRYQPLQEDLPQVT